MDIRTIKNLINLFEGSKLSKLEVSETDNGVTLCVKMDKGEPTAVSASVATEEPAAVKRTAMPEMSEGVVDFNRVDDVKSPMVGVFYTAADPGSEPFVRKGSKVKKGDTLCIIEAMKLMNEVVADRDGEIVEVIAKNGELVEFGQVLFKIY